MNLRVNNLPLHYRDEELRRLFSSYGEVRSAQIIFDRFNGYSRGFGFVEMVLRVEGTSAMKSLDGSLVEGHVISVAEKTAKEERLK